VTEDEVRLWVMLNHPELEEPEAEEFVNWFVMRHPQQFQSVTLAWGVWIPGLRRRHAVAWWHPPL
jgi:hypothetical protein